jgi:hypothetical protein
MKKLGYTVSEMAKLLHLKASEFEEMFRTEVIGDAHQGGQPHLRIVR